MDVLFVFGENIVFKVEYESDYVMKEIFLLNFNFVWLFCVMILEKLQ